VQRELLLQFLSDSVVADGTDFSTTEWSRPFTQIVLSLYCCFHWYTKSPIRKALRNRQIALSRTLCFAGEAGRSVKCLTAGLCQTDAANGRASGEMVLRKLMRRLCEGLDVVS